MALGSSRQSAEKSAQSAALGTAVDRSFPLSGCPVSSNHGSGSVGQISVCILPALELLGKKKKKKTESCKTYIHTVHTPLPQMLSNGADALAVATPLLSIAQTTAIVETALTARHCGTPAPPSRAHDSQLMHPEPVWSNTTVPLDRDTSWVLRLQRRSMN